MSIDFPALPSINQVFTAGNQSWQWDGTVWTVITPAPTGGIWAALAGATFTGQVSGVTPAIAANLTRKDYVDGAVTAAGLLKLSLTGGTMTGQINGITPTANAHLTRRDYVDQSVATRLALTGGTLTGPVNMTTAGISRINLDDTSAPTGANAFALISFRSAGNAVMGYLGYNIFNQMEVRDNRNLVNISADASNVHAGSYIGLNVDGDNAGRVEPAGPNTVSDVTVITREKGDARYLRTTGGALTGVLTINSAASRLDMTDTGSTPGGNLLASMRFFYSDFSLAGQVGFNNFNVLSLVAQVNNVTIASDRSNVAAQSFIQLEVDNAVAGRVEPAGLTAREAVTVMTREKSDERYDRPSYSDVYTITSGGLISFNHGLGYEISSVVMGIQCVVAEAGYAVNDYITNITGNMLTGNTSTPYVLAGNKTTVQVRFGSGANCFSAAHKTTGVTTALTNSSWKLFMVIV